MSLELMANVWRRELPKSPVERFVLISLADQANDDDHTCWPSVAHIARRTGYTERGVQKALQALRVGGFIDIQVGGRSAANGAKRASIYTVFTDPRPTTYESKGEQGSPLRVNGIHPMGEQGSPSDDPRVNTVHPEGEYGSPLRVNTIRPEGEYHSPQSSGNRNTESSVNQTGSKGEPYSPLAESGPTTDSETNLNRPRDLAEVVTYAGTYKVGLGLGECEKFFDHFQANGWRMKSGKVRDWRAALRNWARRADEFRGGPKNSAGGDGERTTDPILFN